MNHQRKVECKMCKQRVLYCSMIEPMPGYYLCKNCSHSWFTRFEQWKKNKDEQKETVSNKPSLEEGTCQFCGHSVERGVIGMGFEDSFPKHVCMACFEKKIKELMK